MRKLIKAKLVPVLLNLQAILQNGLHFLFNGMNHLEYGIDNEENYWIAGWNIA